MIFGSLCSGIEAASVAWNPLGWEAAWFSQFDPEHNYKAGPDFASAVLAHHYPHIPNFGDMTKFKEWKTDGTTIDILVGGTPCQSFSVAGLRKGLADPRGNLMLTYLAIADAHRPRWLVWENVPGVLSSNSGRDFGTFLAGLGELGYGFAYRVLDAQYFGVPQRRRRVFVVGYLGDWRPAAAVLFERHSLSRHLAPGRETREGITCRPEGIAGTISRKWSKGSGGPAGDEHYNPIAAQEIVPALTASGRGVERTGESRGQDPLVMVAHTLRGEGFDASEDGTGRGTPLVPVTVPTLVSNGDAHSGFRDESGLVPVYGITDDETVMADCLPTMPTPSGSGGGHPPAVAFGKSVHTTGHQGDRVVGEGDVHPALSAQGGNNGGGAGALVLANDNEPFTLAIRGRGEGHDLEARQDGTANCLLTPTGGRGGIGVGAIARAMQVRRLTPRECERLQGFPDDYTLITHRGKPAADGPRYKALGNSMAVPVMRWIGERIKLVDALVKPQHANENKKLAQSAA